MKVFHVLGTEKLPVPCVGMQHFLGSRSGEKLLQ